MVKEIHFFDRSPDYTSPNHLATPSPLSRIFGKNSWEGPRTLRLTKRLSKRVLGGQYTFSEVAWWLNWIFGRYDEDWYCSLFSPGSSFKVRGEITPSYSILNSDDISRIKDVNPDMKFIYFVRNPIERDWSGLRYCVDKGFLNVDLTSSDAIIESLKERKELYARGACLRGEYEQSLENYTKHFDSSQILIGFYDAISHNPTDLMFGITEFLGIDAFESTAVTNQTRVNSSSALQIPSPVMDYLTEIHASALEELSKLLGSYAAFWAERESLACLTALPGRGNAELAAVTHV